MTISHTNEDWPYARLLDLKGDSTVTLCFPCRDEAGTIGSLVAASCRVLVEQTGLVDEVVVLDDRSTDDSAIVATAAGARVIDIQDVHRIHGPGRGKGNALWASLVATEGTLMVWCDADLTSYQPDWVARLLGPLLADPSVQMVKASYDRPQLRGGGGRTTELAARPILSILYPELAVLAQPLAGEYAVRRSALTEVQMEEGWGVEIGLIIDLARRFGVSSLAQVDLGTRRHRHQSLEALSIQAAEVLSTALGKSESYSGELGRTLVRPDGTIVPLNQSSRPPIGEVSAGLTGLVPGVTATTKR